MTETHVTKSYEDLRKELGGRGARQLLWKQKKLRFILDNGRPERSTCQICQAKHVGQRGLYDSIKSRPGEKFYIQMPRRRGKTYFLCALAIEYAIAKPNQVIHYAAPTAKAVKKMVRPSFRKILKDCPEEMRPKYNALDGEFVFPNGSVIIVAGCDNENYENLRGTETHLFILDEAGSIDKLEEVVDSIAMPMTLETNASIVCASTPSKSGDHYSAEMAAECQENGTFFHQVIYDNPRLTLEQIDRYIKKAAGRRDLGKFTRSASFRREFMAEQVSDAEDAVVPEWYEMGPQLTAEVPRPSHFDAYTTQDIGFRDGWGVLFGYWNFRKAAVVIEDELLFFNKAKTHVSNAIIEKERELWGEKKPYRRISDIDPVTINDQAIDHQLYFDSVRKEDDKENMVNQLREWVGAGKVIIHPRCKNLLRQLRNTVWNDRRDSYVRSKDGHGDLLDCLVYKVRSIDRQRNPFPNDPSPRNDEHFGVNHGKTLSSDARMMMMMMGKRKFSA